MIGASDHRKIGTRKYLVVFEKTLTGYSAYVPDLPGCIATGDTLEETRRLIREGIEFHIEGMELDGEPIPEPTTVAEYIEIKTEALK